MCAVPGGCSGLFRFACRQCSRRFAGWLTRNVRFAQIGFARPVHLAGDESRCVDDALARIEVHGDFTVALIQAGRMYLGWLCVPERGEAWRESAVLFIESCG